MDEKLRKLQRQAYTSDDVPTLRRYIRSLERFCGFGYKETTKPKLSRLSFLDCEHINMQQFTECCLDCGHNVYKTNDDYRQDLIKELEQKGLKKPDSLSWLNRITDLQEIRAFETILGIGKIV